MAWSLTITPTITLNHGSLPFTPPANVIIKDYTTLTYKFVFAYSGLGTIKKYIAWFGDLKDNVSSPTKRIYLFNDSGTFTASSGSKSPSGSIFFDENGLTAFGGQKFNAGEDMCINAFMQIMDNADSDPYIDKDFTQWFKIADWAPPKILGYTAYRVNALGIPDEAGTKIRYSMSANVTPLTGYGHGEFFLRYKRPADATWTEVPIAENVNSIAVSGVELAGTFPLNESYMFEFVAHDGYVSSIAKSTVFTGSTCLHFNAQKNGIGVGKYSEGAGFDVGWDARFREEVHFDKPVPSRSSLGVPTICSGTIPSISLAADATTTVDVAFPAGLFSGVPDVVATVKYDMGYSATNLVLVAVSSTGTTQSNARFLIMRRGSAITVQLCWTASKMY